MADDYQELRDRMDIMQRKLDEAEKLLSVLDGCPTRERGGAGGMTLQAQAARTRIYDVPYVAFERALFAIRYGEFDHC